MINVMHNEGGYKRRKKKPRRLAIIPARGGSKRIPKKNIKPFLGKPIIIRVLDEVKASGLFDEIHVSTEDDEVASIVSQAGYKPRFRRELDLSINGVLESVVRNYKGIDESFDTIVLIFATAVLLDHRTLKEAAIQFEKGDTSIQMMSIAKFPVPIEWALRMDHDEIVEPIQREKLSVRSQDLEDSWYETADFVFYSESSIFSNNVNSKRRGFKIQYIPVDIDTIDDFKMAEKIYKQMAS